MKIHELRSTLGRLDDEDLRTLAEELYRMHESLTPPARRPVS